MPAGIKTAKFPRELVKHHEGPCLSTLYIEQVCVSDVTLDLHIKPGELVCLSGPSGSGKSLLLRAIADLIPHQGRVRLDEHDCDSMPAHLWRRQVALLPAESQWWADRVGGHFTCTDVALLQSFGFTQDVMNWQVARCSTGEKQRLAICRLLCQQPAALLLDEPTASLDPKNVTQVEKLINRYRQEQQAPVLWVSHDQVQIARMADRHFEISDGQICEQRV